MTQKLVNYILQKLCPMNVHITLVVNGLLQNTDNH